MAANTSPIFSLLGDVQSAGALIRTAATVVYDGSGTIGTDIYKLFTADATNGGFVQRARFKYVAESGTTTSVACVIKLFISSVSSGSTTDANTWLYDEITVPATGALTTTAALPVFEIPLGFALPPGYTILAKVTAGQPANCGFIGTVLGGKY